MATFRVGDLIKEQPDGSRALQTTLTGSDNVVKAELTGSNVDVPVNVKGSRTSTKFAYRAGAMPTDTIEIIAQVQKECVIHAITINFEEDNPNLGYIRLSFWDGSIWTPYRVFETPNLDRAGISPSRAANNGLWIPISQNGNGEGYVITWRRELQVKGFMVEVINPSSIEEKAIACSVLWTEVS